MNVSYAPIQVYQHKYEYEYECVCVRVYISLCNGSQSLSKHTRKSNARLKSETDVGKFRHIFLATFAEPPIHAHYRFMLLLFSQ